MNKTIQRVNYHTHCDRCRHARGCAEEYVKEAVKAGVTNLGFSDHMPFYDDRFGLRMPYAELEDYLREITALREAYRDKLTISRGFEGEYVRGDNAYYEKLLSRDDCDYLLLGQHFYEKADGELINVYQLGEENLGIGTVACPISHVANCLATINAYSAILIAIEPSS